MYILDVVMTLKVDFKYEKEDCSFLDKTFTIGAIVFLLFIFLVGYFNSDFITTISIIGIILFVYLLIGIKTIFLLRERSYYKRNGVKCFGKIVNFIVEEHLHISDEDGIRRIERCYLVVEYVNPYTNDIVQFTTDRVNANPYIYLSSLDVTVYALKDGRAYVTDFKKIKKLKDAVRYQDDFKGEVTKVKIDKKGNINDVGTIFKKIFPIYIMLILLVCFFITVFVNVILGIVFLIVSLLSIYFFKQIINGFFRK